MTLIQRAHLSMWLAAAALCPSAFSLGIVLVAGIKHITPLEMNLMLINLAGAGLLLAVRWMVRPTQEQLAAYLESIQPKFPGRAILTVFDENGRGESCFYAEDGGWIFGDSTNADSMRHWRKIVGSEDFQARLRSWAQ